MAKQNFTFKGIDASLEISLFEYGLMVSNELHEDGSGTQFCVYKIGEDMFDTGHISNDAVNGYVQGKEFMDDKDIASFLSFVGLSSEEWQACDITNKLYDLINYWGIENIMGSSYGGVTEKVIRDLFFS